jgi:cytochrome c556
MSTREHERCWLMIALCCALLGCGEDKPSNPEPETPRSTAETSDPSGLSAESPPATEPAPPEVAPLAPVPDPPGERAYAHFDAAGQASRAILEGDLKKAAPHLAWLAHHQYSERLPPAWQPYAARFQLAARVLARATTVGEAVRSLPALDAACGACHAALAKTDFNATEAPVGHGDGAYALLDGLGGPADKLFARAAWAAPRLKDADKADRAALQALQEGSAQAAKATTWVERLAATETLFAQCGSCHVGLR